MSRGLPDVLALQREIAHAVADEIQAKLSPPEKVRLSSAHPVNSEAYEDYLKGNFLVSKAERETTVRRGIAYFQQAIQKDPNYASAYAGLAESYIALGQPWIGAMSPKEVLPQAKAAATKALEFDDSLGEAHLALARVIQLYDWDWRGAEKEYMRALELNPNNAGAHVWYSEYLQAMGRNEEALAQLRQAIALDPLGGHVATLGYVFFTARQYDEGIRAFQKALEMEPDNIGAHSGLGWVYGEKKMYKEATAELEKAVNLSNRREDLTVAVLGKVLGDSGRKQEARKLLEELEGQSKHRYVSPYSIALLQIGLGERDEAIASLEQGYVDRDLTMMWLKMDPQVDSLRSDSRFQDLLRRVDLPR
jgi:tetratricopeptide (TPR) repeat protein